MTVRHAFLLVGWANLAVITLNLCINGLHGFAWLSVIALPIQLAAQVLWWKGRS